MLTNLEDTKNISVLGRFISPSERYQERKRRSKLAQEAKKEVKSSLSKGIKLCTKCNEEKSLTMFDKDKTTYTGYSSWCKCCKKEYNQRYRLSDNIKEDLDDKTNR